MKQAAPVYTVRQLNHLIKNLLESAPFLKQISVKGEISNLTRHSSGHYYFSLKDAESQLACVLFRGQAAGLLFEPQAGDQVVVQADLTVYLARGNYQLLVSKMEKEGQGDLYARFLQLKAQLEAEGLFDSRKKKAIPRFPQQLGVVTSPTGAVIHDIQNTLNRRFPAITLTLAPARVQGQEAVGELIAALRMLDRQPHIDLIILARGGGSLEDLWCFNDERLVRTVAALKKPVISAIGHETDFTLVDFAADLRAPTPTAAAELAVPDQQELHAQLNDLENRLGKGLRGILWAYQQYTDDLLEKCQQGLRQQIRLRRHQLETQKQRLTALDYRNILRRGFSITSLQGKRVSSIQQLQQGDQITGWLSDGQFDAFVTETKPSHGKEKESRGL
jgi:exodeoxyribonuclease VII large subunit